MYGRCLMKMFFKFKKYLIRAFSLLKSIMPPLKLKAVYLFMTSRTESYGNFTVKLDNASEYHPVVLTV